MLFNSAVFAAFFAAVFVLHWLVARRERPRLLLLLAASYVFYGYWSWRFLGLIAFSTVLDYAVGLALARARAPRRRKALLAVSLTGNLGLLGFFKYWGFFAAEAARLLAAVGVEAGEVFTGIVLPVGISFYTFQTLSYTIDVYRGTLAAEKSLLRFAVFVAFFPQLVAGPIVRAAHFLPQLARAPGLDQERLESGLSRIALGLIKKVAIADVLGRSLVDPFWADPGAYGGWRSLLAIYGYAFQIYGDFAGYSDCAIGTARLLGLELGENFRAPYRATSLRDFWRRWHVSLSTWLRDYLYVPLGGNRGGPRSTYRNLMLTMLLGGLWHGAAWTFVAWGALHGAGLALERRLGIGEPRGAAAAWARRVVVLHLVCLAWIPFRSPDAASALAVLASLAGGSGTAAISWPPLLALAAAAAAHAPSARARERVHAGFLRAPSVLQGFAYGAAIALIAHAQAGPAPFLYFQF